MSCFNWATTLNHVIKYQFSLFWSQEEVKRQQNWTHYLCTCLSHHGHSSLQIPLRQIRIHFHRQNSDIRSCKGKESRTESSKINSFQRQNPNPLNPLITYLATRLVRYKLPAPKIKNKWHPPKHDKKPTSIIITKFIKKIR